MCALLLVWAGLSPPVARAQVVFSPPVWKFGSILKGQKIQITVRATNAGKEDVILNVLPTCTCLAVTPAERTIRPGAAGSFVLVYDSSDDTGITRKDFVIWTRPPGLAPRSYSLTGVVRAERQSAAPAGDPPGIRRGRPAEILLQLPSLLKRQIHSSIRSQVRAAGLAGSSLVLGFLVSVFEFACTGQVYLPTLAWLVRTGPGPATLGLLLLYNVCFILPLLAVFGASWLGASSGRITGLFQAHMGKVKLALAAVFAALAVFTLVG